MASHYHSRWSTGKLDWERFETPDAAELRATGIVRKDESYTVDEHNEQCPFCAVWRARATKSNSGDH